jgi:DNA-binding IclR family transcriptional regulator
MTPASEAVALARFREGDAATTPRRDGIQVITRAAEVLRHLASDRGGLTIAELASRVELPRSTTHRIVRALSEEGFTRAGSSGRYSIGPGLIGIAATGRRELRIEAASHLQKLSSQLGETVDLAVLSGTDVVFVDQYVSSQMPRVVSEIGARFPVHCTANGKALLAALAPRRVRRLLPKTLERLTPHTITSRGALLRELDDVRLSGVACDLEEHSTGICAVSTTISDRGSGTAALTVVVPSARFDEKADLVAALLRTRDQIHRAIGLPQRLP